MFFKVCSNVAQYMKTMEKPRFFRTFFYDFKGSQVFKIGEKCDNIEPGVLWNANACGVPGQIGQFGCTSDMWDEKSVAKMMFGRGGARSGPKKAQRAGPSYARFLSILTRRFEDWKFVSPIYKP